jgi:hypothetical protein
VELFHSQHIILSQPIVWMIIIYFANCQNCWHTSNNDLYNFAGKRFPSKSGKWMSWNFCRQFSNWDGSGDWPMSYHTILYPMHSSWEIKILKCKILIVLLKTCWLDLSLNIEKTPKQRCTTLRTTHNFLRTTQDQYPDSRKTSFSLLFAEMCNKNPYHCNYLRLFAML